ncbi:DUF397 domain-containing protein [Streptomyces chartreusis]
MPWAFCSTPQRRAIVSRRWQHPSPDDGGECVEVADSLPGIIPVRDSKNPEGPALVFPTPVWALFVAAL